MHTKSIYLKQQQIDKLRRVLTPTIPIYPTPTLSAFPTIHITPKDFLRKVLLKLDEHSIEISGVRLHGGAASYVLVNDSDFVYRDIDILFLIKTPLSSQQQTTLFSYNNEPYLCDIWTKIKYIVSSCLLEHIPNSSSCTQYFISSVLDTYTKKNIQISSEHDSWALLTLQNLLGQNLELKFVENLKRQWQFSVDSFQIDIKPLLLEKSPSPECNPELVTTRIPSKSLIINAINSVTIVKADTEVEENTSTSPLQFGFFSPSSLPNINEDDCQKERQTLATITTVQTPSTTSLSESHSSLSNQYESVTDDDPSECLQFQLSISEDVDDGIEADADDSPNEDDDQVFRTPISASMTDISTASSNMIEVFSAYKDLHEALYHLNNKLIATYEPEAMRGGGLLKYCDLLARNYKPYDVATITHMQRYMCSRFFIDYKTIQEQIHVIIQYVSTHFLPLSIDDHYPMNNFNELTQLHYAVYNQFLRSRCESKHIDPVRLINARLCLVFFEYLLSVIYRSTVCLTHEDRELLLFNITLLKERFHLEYEPLFSGDQQHYEKYHLYHPNLYAFQNPSLYPGRVSSPSSKTYGSYRGHSHRNSQSHRQSTNASYHGGRNNAEHQTYHRRYQS